MPAKLTLFKHKIGLLLRGPQTISSDSVIVFKLKS